MAILRVTIVSIFLDPVMQALDLFRPPAGTLDEGQVSVVSVSLVVVHG